MSKLLQSLSKKDQKKKYDPLEGTLNITDLDEFFGNSYVYFINKGYKNILAQTILDNITYFFVIHFFFLNAFLVEWMKVIDNCVKNSKCEIKISEIVNFENFGFKTFVFYTIFICYYIWFTIKHVSYVRKMKNMKEIYNKKLKIRQKDLENIDFKEIIKRIIELQDVDNFCRVKEHLTEYDLIARIMRKENYLIALISNNIIDMRLSFCCINKNFLTSYVYKNLQKYVMNYMILKQDVAINPNFLNLRRLQLKLLMSLFIELIFIVPVFVLKILFWIFRNADNFKTNQNLNKKVWSIPTQLYFRNYNELYHVYETRVQQSYRFTENFLGCFKERLFSILSKFIILICGSFLILILILSVINDKLLLDLTLFGLNLMWYALAIGAVLGIARSLETEKGNDNLPEKYLSLQEYKAELYKNLVNKLINIPENWSKSQNFSSKFKEIHKEYKFAILSLIFDLCSVLLFPILWLKLIINSRQLIKFVKSFTHNIEGIGDVCSLSIINIGHFEKLRQKPDFLNTKANDKKFLNSLLFYKNAGLSSSSSEAQFIEKVSQVLVVSMNEDELFTDESASVMIPKPEDYKENIHYMISEFYSEKGNVFENNRFVDLPNEPINIC